MYVLEEMLDSRTFCRDAGECLSGIFSVDEDSLPEDHRLRMVCRLEEVLVRVLGRTREGKRMVSCS